MDINRREALRLTSILTGAAVAVGCGWLPKQKPEGVPATSSEEASWRGLLAAERIHRLEELDYPKVPGLDPQKELALSTAEFFCEETGCKKPPGEMIRKVFFMDKRELMATLKAERRRDFYNQEEWQRDLRRMDHLLPNGRVFINADVFKLFTEGVFMQQPQPVSDSDKKRIETRVRKSVLLRSFSRMNETRETYDSMYLTSFYGLGKNVTFTRMEGWKVLGRRPDGTTVELNGLADAMHELVAVSVGEKSGGYIGIEDYSDGAAILELINRKVGISREDFVRYVRGELPLRNYLKKVSSQNPFGPNEQIAFAVLVNIGLIAEGIIPKEQRELHTRTTLETFLGIKTNE